MILLDEAATEAAGRDLAPSLRVGDIVGLFGKLGAGKTSSARGVLAGLGFLDDQIVLIGFDRVIDGCVWNRCYCHNRFSL